MAPATVVPGPGLKPEADLASLVYLELRKEILEHQKLRTQFVGFKITLVSAGIGLIGANREKVSDLLLIAPALAAIFFDLIIVGYSASIRRAGAYCRTVIEPALKSGYSLPDGFKMWEQWVLEHPENVANIGNVGLTVLASVGALVVLFVRLPLWWAVLWAACLLGILAYDLAMILRASPRGR